MWNRIALPLLGAAWLAGCAPPPSVELARSALGAVATLYLNFDGAALTQSATDDAPKDQSELGAAIVPPFGRASSPSLSPAQAIASITDRVRGWFAPYDVDVVSARPASGAYTMVVIGGPETLLRPSSTSLAGLAPLDCDNANPSNIAFDFSDDQTPARGGLVSVAITAAHESGHAFGLEHIDDPLDPMYAAAQTAQTYEGLFHLRFGAGHFSAFGADAPSTTEACGRADPLDNDALLRAALGTRAPGPDVTPPTLAWTGTSLSTVPPSLPVSVDASDDVGVVRVEVYKNFDLVAIPPAAPYSATVSADDGEEFYVTVEAIDAAAHRTTLTRHFTAQLALPALCGNPPQCPDGATCQNELCLQQLGRACSIAADCLSADCEAVPGVATLSCTTACSSTAPCPTGFACRSARCAPVPVAPAPTGGCTCAFAGGPERAGWPLLLALVACVLVRRWRRAWASG